MIFDRLIPEITSIVYSGNRVFNREFLSVKIQIEHPMAQINALVMKKLFLKYIIPEIPLSPLPPIFSWILCFSTLWFRA